MLRVHFIRSTLILYILGLPLLSFGNPTKTSSLLEPIEKIPTATDSISIQLSANFQSRHIWRGALTCDAWNIQPTINFSNKKFLVGFGELILLTTAMLRLISIFRTPLATLP